MVNISDVVFLDLTATAWPSLMALHEEWKPEDSDGYDRPRRAPFAYDLRSAYEREGDSIKDKTIKLPEMKKQGYGIHGSWIYNYLYNQCLSPLKL
jgi:hypothetical protein